jgi:membrane protease YdiL (CAAX protease family)
MVSLCYFLVRPAFSRVPALSIVFSTLFSAIVFGLGHGEDLINSFLNIGLLYGLPMAVIYVRRDWEHTVGAHYMIDLIPWIMVFLETI